LLACGALSAAASLWSQSYTPGPQVLTFASAVDDSQQPYALYLPASFDAARKYPLVISLHSEESTHRLNLMQVLGQGERAAGEGRIAFAYPRPVRGLGYIVAAPLARGTMGYRGIAEKDVYDVLADVQRRFPIDEDRVYLTGISMGGGGALWLALTRPDVWAAVAPVCPLPIPGTEDRAPNALNLPIRLFHGEQDPITPAASSRRWQRLLLDVSDPAEYFEYPSVRHNAWDYAYKDGSLFDWFAKFRRSRYPERVRFQTDAYRYSSAYWVRIDSLTPGMWAAIDARQTGPAAVKVETKQLDGFTLSLDHPVSAVTIDGATVRVTPAATLSFHEQAGRWVMGRAAPAGKQPGLEGPIVDAVSGRHLYVYGTGGSPSAEDLNLRRREAETAASWSTLRERLQLSLRVKADSQVTQQDLDSGDLVLFGTRETNSLIARFAARLPLALNPGAADYGLLFIADLGKHYALVSSGLPWWTGFDAATQADRFAPPSFAELSTFPDYVVFKGSLANVVAEGRFDRNWKVPADAAFQIAATGTVTIR
jgi:dienelactone hydrolase